ncbi:MAG TPA: response regulator transcription factor [Ignavibacteriaceae bacterium]|nr:response regulator transcription factor [Ignavibacteriaceae bacterium]
MEKLIGIQKINIVLIEDNNLFRKTLSNFINQSEEMCCNYSFASCEDALIEVESKNLEPDIILLDIGLPGMNGVDCIPQIKKNYPDSKIVMLTIQDDDESVFKAICRGASGYLLKDSTSANIFESVKEVLNGGAPMNSSIAAKVLRMFRNYIPLKKEYNLSTREKEILKLLVDGLSKRLIAEKLYLSYHTIDSHIRKIYEKLEVHSNSSAVAKALREKLI